MFNPHKKINLDEIVPSERDDFFRYSKLHGYVHDEGAAMLGGISGHAGLFSNSYEVAVVLQTMIQKGAYNNQKLFSSDSAGGAQMFKEPEKGNQEINIKRSDEAIKTESKIVAVSCPFCNTMMNDGMTSKQKDIDVVDIAQMIEKAEDL